MKKIFLLTIALCSSIAFGQSTFNTSMEVKSYTDNNSSAPTATLPLPYNFNDVTSDTGLLANRAGRTILEDYVGEYTRRKIKVSTIENGREVELFNYFHNFPEHYFSGIGAEVQDMGVNDTGSVSAVSTLPPGFREFAAAYGGQNGTLSAWNDGRFALAGSYVGPAKNFDVVLTILRRYGGTDYYGRTFYVHRMLERNINFVENQSFFDNKVGTRTPITVKIDGGNWRHYVRLVVKDASGNVIQTVGETRTSGVAGNNTATFTPTTPLQAGTLEAQIIYYNFHKDSNNEWQPNPNSFNRAGASETRILRTNNAYINPNLRSILR